MKSHKLLFGVFVCLPASFPNLNYANLQAQKISYYRPILGKKELQPPFETAAIMNYCTTYFR